MKNKSKEDISIAKYCEVAPKECNCKNMGKCPNTKTKEETKKNNKK